MSSLEEWLAESCAAQGLPIHVEDPIVLAKVAALLLAAIEGEPDRARQVRRA